MPSRRIARHSINIHDFSQVGTVAETSFDISDFTKSNQKNRPATVLSFAVTFNKTRQEFFRRYTQYATFSETLNKGRYNCLTGTALYALLLDHFGIGYNIMKQLSYFLLAETDDGQALFEATDPIDGFVTDSKQLHIGFNSISGIRLRNCLSTAKDIMLHDELYQPVGLPELLGLLHYKFPSRHTIIKISHPLSIISTGSESL